MSDKKEAEADRKRKDLDVEERKREEARKRKESEGSSIPNSAETQSKQDVRGINQHDRCYTHYRYFRALCHKVCGNYAEAEEDYSNILT